MPKYLEKDQVRELIDYINNSLESLGDKINDIKIPNDIVNTALFNSLANDVNINTTQINTIKSQYAKKSEVIDSLPSDLVYEADLNNYATIADIAELESHLQGIYHFRGTVANLAALQAIQNPIIGDVYNLADTGMNAAWDGQNWDDFGTIVDLTGYVRIEDVQAITHEELNAILYSGKTAVVTSLSGISSMLVNDEPEITITLNKDITTTSNIVIPKGKKVILDLGGNTLNSNAVLAAVNGGELVVKNGNIEAISDVIVASNGATVTIDGANITSTARNAISAIESDIIVNGGSISSQEAGIVGLKNSTIIFNNGTITGIDNCPLMGNGSAAGSANDGTNMNIIMNGGKLIAHIQSAGYIACGVYMPNSGSFTMNDGEIISDGAGIVMRGGKVILNGGKITANGTAGATGKVGDSRQIIGSYAIVYDVVSSYPAVDTLELVIGKNMDIQGTDGDLQFIGITKEEANFIDNRI